jgi:hypothetical protein
MVEKYILYTTNVFTEALPVKYETLLKIIDQLRLEAPEKQSSRYRPPLTEVEKINAARSRAFIHLYLKVFFGILDFQAREKYIRA